VTIFSPGCGFRNFLKRRFIIQFSCTKQRVQFSLCGIRFFFVMITAFEWKVSNVYLALGFLGDAQEEFDKFGALFERASLK